jgi:hypothetical protein
MHGPAFVFTQNWTPLTADSHRPSPNLRVLGVNLRPKTKHDI